MITYVHTCKCVYNIIIYIYIYIYIHVCVCAIYEYIYIYDTSIPDHPSMVCFDGAKGSTVRAIGDSHWHKARGDTTGAPGGDINLSLGATDKIDASPNENQPIGR